MIIFLLFVNHYLLLKKNLTMTILSTGKGAIPYEKIIGVNSLDLQPEMDFFSKDEFYSKLKQKKISDEEYERSKYLFSNLEMRNLNDMNDLYNAKDVILLFDMFKTVLTPENVILLVD